MEAWACVNRRISKRPPRGSIEESGIWFPPLSSARLMHIYPHIKSDRVTQSLLTFFTDTFSCIMSKFDTLPPNTYPARDDALKPEHNAIPDHIVEAHPGGEIDMAEYKATTPLWRRFHQHSLTQMMLLSIQAFCGPAMDDAIAGLGGGGLATPQTANTA